MEKEDIGTSLLSFFLMKLLPMMFAYDQNKCGCRSRPHS